MLAMTVFVFSFMLVFLMFSFKDVFASQSLTSDVKEPASW